MGTLGLQPWGIIIPAGAGWEPGAKQELTRANWPTCLTEHSRKGKAGPGVLSIHSERAGQQQPLVAPSDYSV